MRLLARLTIVALVALIVGGGLFALSFDYPHAWMPVAFSAFVIWFFARASWIPTVPFRIFACLAVCFNVTGLFLVSSVQRMNIFQQERPVVLDYLLWAGVAFTVVAFLCIFPVAKNRKTVVLVFLAVLMASVIGYASSTEGGPSSMVTFFQRVVGMGPEQAELATVIARKTIHFLFYGTFAVLLLLAMRAAKVELKTALKVALFTTLILASFDEIRQSTADSRTGSVLDVLLDMAGATALCLVATATKGVRSR